MITDIIQCLLEDELPVEPEGDNDLEDWKDTVSFHEEVIPADLNWWGDKQTNWRAKRYPKLIITTERSGNHLTIFQFRQSWADEPYQVDQLVSVLKSVVHQATEIGFRHALIVFRNGDGHAEMKEAVEQAAKDGAFKITERSAYFTSITFTRFVRSRKRKVAENEEDDLDLSVASDVIDADPEGVVSLADIKAAVPLFFNRRAMRFHQTKKIYKYGNFLVLQNVRQSRNYFGHEEQHASYVVYKFIHDEENPAGRLQYCGDFPALTIAKQAILKGKFNNLL